MDGTVMVNVQISAHILLENRPICPSMAAGTVSRDLGQAALTLAGLAINTLWHINWVDAAATFLALPIPVLEGRRVFRGESHGCS